MDPLDVEKKFVHVKIPGFRQYLEKLVKNLLQEFGCSLGFLDGLVFKKIDDQSGLQVFHIQIFFNKKFMDMTISRHLLDGCF